MRSSISYQRSGINLQPGSLFHCILITSSGGEEEVVGIFKSFHEKGVQEVEKDRKMSHHYTGNKTECSWKVEQNRQKLVGEEFISEKQTYDTRKRT